MKLWIVCLLFTLSITGSAAIGYGCGKRTSPPSCGVADSYGYHDNNNPEHMVTCPDKRQTMDITRKGMYMGSFEYLCHCD